MPLQANDGGCGVLPKWLKPRLEMPPSAKDRKKMLERGVVIMGGDQEKHRNEGHVALQTLGQALALDSEGRPGPPTNRGLPYGCKRPFTRESGFQSFPSVCCFLKLTSLK